MNELLARTHARLSALARPNTPAPARAGVRIENAANTATVYVFDEIGYYGVSAAELVPALRALDVPAIEVRINSPGGDYFDGVAIANALAEHPATVTAHVDGLAASAASVIAMGADRVVMHPGAQLMIHDALTMTIGNAADHDKARAVLDAASEDIAALYATRAGGAPAEWRDRMRAETWYRGEDAVAAGLAHEYAAPTGEQPEQAQPRWAALLTEWRAVAGHLTPETSTPAGVAAVSPDETALPTASAALPTLSELLCSALSERRSL